MVFNCVSVALQYVHGDAKEKDVCVSLEHCLKYAPHCLAAKLNAVPAAQILHARHGSG